MTETKYPELPQMGKGLLYVMSPVHTGEVMTVEAAREYADATCAMRAAEPVAVAWEVVNKEIGYRAIFATETKAKCVADQHDEAGYSQAAILPLCYATPATQPAPQPQEASAFQGKVTRHSDQSVLVTFSSCRLASEFEKSLGADEAPADQHQDAAPFLWVSPKQAEAHTDPDDASGRYLPARKTSVGKFTMALYAAPPQEVTPSQGADDAARWRVVIDLLRDALDPLEVSAAVIESDDAEQLDGLIDRIKRVLDQYDAARAQQEGK